MKKMLVICVAALMLIGLLAACTQQTAAPTQPTPQATEPAGEVPSGPLTFADGTYTAQGEKDSRGWTATVEIVVSGGQITEVAFDEFHEDGRKKSTDEEYQQSWKESSDNAIWLPDVYAALHASLIASQNPYEVDEVTGATGSWTKFTALAAEALQDAIQ